MSEPKLPLIVDGPFQGMMANSRVDAPPGFLSFIQNYIIRDGELEPRQGLLQIGSAIGGGNDVQGIHQWELLDGTQYTCAFSDGDLYIYNWGLDSWTLTASAGVDYTLSSTGDVNCAVSRGRLIFTDGINDPVMLVGPVDGGETFTTLAAAAPSHRVDIYYDKVMFADIPGYENEFWWSDEGDPTAGYSGEDQAWEFAQRDAGRITGIAPLNERMCVFKEDSATVLLGNADENFQTLAVREGLSETEGCVAGGSVVVLNGDVYLLSANGPRRVRQGQVWESLNDVGGVDVLRDVWSEINVSALSTSIGWADRTEKHIGWLIPQSGETDLNTALVHNTENASFTIFDFGSLNLTAVGSVEDTDGDEWVLFGDEDGNVYKYRIGYTQKSDGGSAITYKIEKRISDGTHMKKRLIEGAFVFHLDGDCQGELYSIVDGEIRGRKLFGIHDETGEKRYRRGFNDCGFELGWGIEVSRANHRLTVQKATIMATAVELSEDWDG